MGGGISSKSSLNREKLRRHMLQNYMLIWVDGNIDETSEDCQNTLTQLRFIVREINMCLTSAQCIEALNEIEDGKAFVISSGSLGEDVVPKIHDMACVDAIFIFCGNKTRHESWVGQWVKIRGVFTSIVPICRALREAANECDHNSISMSFVPKTTETIDEGNKNQLPPSYMYSTLFKEIILETHDNTSQSMNSLITYCEKKNVPKDEIEEFHKNYRRKNCIWWYSRQIFLYGMLNYGLRSLDMEAMMKLGFFIRHLHLQLQKLHQEQSKQFTQQFIVYRGQALETEEFQQLCNIKGGLLSFNCFLSTSKQKNVAMNFVKQAFGKRDNVVVLFIMTIDPEKVCAEKTPFAMIHKYSAMPDEQEILFSMHTVFIVNDIKQSSENEQIWEVQLVLSDDNDSQLITLTERMAEDIQGSPGWFQMGKLMLQVGDFAQAEELYNRLFDQYRNNSCRAPICHQLAFSKYNQGEYNEAIELYNKSLELYRKTLPEDHIRLAPIYNNIAAAYNSMGDYSKSFEYYEKSLEIRKKVLPPDHPDLATSYNNIGYVYNGIGDYKKAFEYYEKAHILKEKALPPNHPDLATSYNNIAQVYNDIGDYEKAFQYYEKSLEIRKKALPRNHPDLAISYNNICMVQHDLGNYRAALKAVKTSLEIMLTSRSEGSPTFASSYSLFGRIYRSMKYYPCALENFEKCLAIFRKTLPEKHRLIGLTYSNIGDVYRLMGNYEKALKYHENALSIQESMKCSLLECATTYMNIGETYHELNDYKKTMEYFEKALKIREGKLPRNHPDLARLYHNIAKTLSAIQHNSIAVKYAQQAVNIAQERLPGSHPHFIEYRINFENIRMKI